MSSKHACESIIVDAAEPVTTVVSAKHLGERFALAVSADMQRSADFIQATAARVRAHMPTR